MKLQHKFFLSYLFIIILFSVFQTVIFSHAFISQAKKDRISSAEKTYLQTASLLDYQFSQYLYATFIASNSDEVVRAQTIPRTELLASVGLQYSEALSLRNSLHRSASSLTNIGMRLYVDDGFHHMLDHTLLEKISYLEQYPWYEDFLKDNTITTWQVTVQKPPYTSDEIPTLSLFRKVNTTPSQGWICELYINQKELQDILANADPTNEGFVFLQSDDNTVLSTTNTELTDLLLQSPDNFYLRGRMSWDNISLAGKNYWIYSRSINSTNWYVTLLLPSDVFFYKPDKLLKSTMLMLIVITLISLPAASIFTRKFSHRILQLNEKMAVLCVGNLDVHVDAQGKDEITQLFHSFNHMVESMRFLVQQQYENGIRIKNAELIALQAQINPHFLYNTLELISWKAMENDAEEIVTISQDLASFYRLTLSNGRSMVSLQDELQHITHYVSIQNCRFSQEIRIFTEVPDDCLRILIPKLTLQPLIENSILHGFLPKEASEAENSIFIKATKTDDILLLTLQDNGIGMPSEKLNDLLSKKGAESKKGFGIINIQERLQLLYGDNFGLSYSTSEQGVCVSIRFKIEK